MALAKMLVYRLFFPLPVVLFFLFGGLYFLWFTKRHNVGKSLVTLSGLLLLLCSSMVFGFLSLRPVETQYRPYGLGFEIDGPAGKYPVKYVVVLGGGQHSQAGLPLTSFLTHESLVRLIEGIRINRQHKESRLVLAGGKGLDSMPEAETMQAIALDLGVKAEDMIVEAQGRDTAEQVKFIQNIVGDSLFVLVTSAAHMPRAMALFAKNGLKPIPAPTGQYSRDMRGFRPDILFPRAEGVRMVERAIYEFLGTWWARLTKQI
ncbi:MAG: hypothetical protein A2511_08235 [Deltaproteobacteria bacterium RIFOXYD12_FULL_50_9]|nr:MAG: hypothetical protein A2511_08235 [Deltaproteobacteria bacterium RIFOXYD12_FULL_50_9]